MRFDIVPRTSTYVLVLGIVLVLGASAGLMERSFSVTGYATADTTATVASPTTAAAIDTLIVVNGGEVSTVDAAIAASISADTGVPVLYTHQGDVSASVLTELISGEYKDVAHVVILGGSSVVSNTAENSLEQVGETAGYDVTRIAGTTGTGTAVEAIEYFYGPEMVSEVTLVSYDDDSSKEDYDELLLAAQLGHPIIPVPEDVTGLPADVAETLDTVGIDKVTIVGDFTQETIVEADLKDLAVKIDAEIEGDGEVLEEKLEEKVKEAVKEGDKIIFVEEGEAPPILPDHKIFFFKDENNDNIDDETGSVLDGIGRGLYDELKTKFGRKVDSFKFFDDNPETQKRFKEEMEKQGVKVSLGKPGDSVETSIQFSREETKDIADHFKERDEDFEKRFEQNKQYFEEKLPLLLDQFKAFYTTDKEKFSAESLEIGAKIIDESNKGDAKAQWQLMHAFASSYKHEQFDAHCRDAACRREQVQSEHADIDQRIVKVAGRERARQVANLDAGEKVGLLGIDEFAGVQDNEEIRQNIEDALAAGAKPEELYKKFVEEHKKDAQAEYWTDVKEEYKAYGKGADPAKWTPEEMRTRYEERLGHESEAYLAGVYKPEYDAKKRGEVLYNIEQIDKTFEAKGIKDSHYLTEGEWKEAYEDYNRDGKISDADIKKYEAATTAYRTYETTHQGEYQDPHGGTYDAKSGQFSYVDPSSGSFVSGAYDSKGGTYTYTNEQGELVQGTKTGTVSEYTQSNLPAGYTYNTATGGYAKEGVTYTPPATGGTYNAETGAYSGGTYVDSHTGESHSYTYTPPADSYPSGSTYSYTPPSGTSGTSTGGTTTSGSTTYSGTTSTETHSTSTGTYSGGTTSTGSTSTYSGGTTSSGSTESYSAPAPAPSGDSGGHGH